MSLNKTEANPIILCPGCHRYKCRIKDEGRPVIGYRDFLGIETGKKVNCKVNDSWLR